MQKGKALVVDFDGTLVTTNSFELFFLWFLRTSLRKFLTGSFLRLLLVLCLRKLRIITHSELKRRTLSIYDKTNVDACLCHFINHLVSYINARLVSVIDDYRSRGYHIIVSTAAPRFYVEKWLENVKMEVAGIVATEMPDDDKEWEENQREVKKRRTLNYLDSYHLMMSVFITDCHDDMPLLRCEKEKNILVNPSKEILMMADKERIQVELL